MKEKKKTKTSQVLGLDLKEKGQNKCPVIHAVLLIKKDYAF